MRDEWTDRLSEYIDGELSDDERRALESHLAGCPTCAATLAELRQVVERARDLGPRPPEADLWPAISRRISAHSPVGARIAQFRAREPRRLSLTFTQLAAAAVVLIAISSAIAWQIADRSAKASRDVDTAAASAAAVPDATAPETERDASAERHLEPVSLADADYDAAVADLERALAKGRGRLDKTTIAIVEENLTIIDRAIAQARDALAADPANSYLSGHLIEARRRKLDLLRRAAALTTETN
jgi:anti-sigma factor RsiW